MKPADGAIPRSELQLNCQTQGFCKDMICRKITYIRFRRRFGKTQNLAHLRFIGWRSGLQASEIAFAVGVALTNRSVRWRAKRILFSNRLKRLEKISLTQQQRTYDFVREPVEFVCLEETCDYGQISVIVAWFGQGLFSWGLEGAPSFMKEFEMENPGSDYNTSEWKKLVKEAVVEVNPERLKEKVAEAEAAIFQRLQALQRNSGSSAELHALQDASNTLLVLKREVLKYPDWKSE